MRTDERPANAAPILLSAAVLLWPALWNGYPLVFSDTGTYLSQAIEHYLGWDRPVFYSLFLLPLHMTLTTWPVIVVQALLVTHTLHLVRRALLPQVSGWWLLPCVGFLSVATALPWFASQLMPDIFTPLLVLAPGASGARSRATVASGTHLAGDLRRVHDRSTSVPPTACFRSAADPAAVARPARCGDIAWPSRPPDDDHPACAGRDCHGCRECRRGRARLTVAVRQRLPAGARHLRRPGHGRAAP